MQFGLVGENQIDGSITHQIEKFAAIAIHAKGVRERQRNLPPGAMCDVGGFEKGFLGAFGSQR